MITLGAAALLTTVPAARSGPARAEASSAHRQLAATGYWTPARMRAAVRMTGSADDARVSGDTQGSALRWTRGGAVARATGKVFFTLDRTDYVCSGAVVASRGHDVVLTAAHCTGDGPGDWATHWTFVPGYNDGAAPYGSYFAHRFYVSPRWEEQQRGSSAAAERYDVAFVTVNPSPVTGRRVGQAVVGLPVSFGGGLGGRDTYVFGYPSDPPFGGQYQDFCAGRASDADDDGAASVACGMTAGDSGGPWVTGLNPRTGSGAVTAVSTYKYTDGARLLYGTRLGPSAKSLYDAADARG